MSLSTALALPIYYPPVITITSSSTATVCTTSSESSENTSERKSTSTSTSTSETDQAVSTQGGGGGGGSSKTRTQKPTRSHDPTTTTRKEPTTSKEPSTSTEPTTTSDKPSTMTSEPSSTSSDRSATSRPDGNIVTIDGDTKVVEETVAEDGGITTVNVAASTSALAVAPEESAAVVTVDIVPVPAAVVTEGKFASIFDHGDVADERIAGPASTVSTFVIVPVEPPPIVPVAVPIAVPIAVPVAVPVRTSDISATTIAWAANVTRTATTVPILFTGGACREKIGVGGGTGSVLALLGVLGAAVVVL
jgi:hypothetical protein